MLASFQGCTDGSAYEKSVNMIWHINRIKDTNQVILLEIQEGPSTKCKFFIIKVMKETKSHKIIPQLNQRYKRQTIGNITINRDKQKELLLKSEISQECPLCSLTQYWSWHFSQILNQKKEIEVLQKGKEERTHTIRVCWKCDPLPTHT